MMQKALPVSTTRVYDSKNEQTKFKKFLETMETGIPWRRLIEVIEWHYPKSGTGPTDGTTQCLPSLIA